MSKPLIMILGPTATGKTRKAALLAARIGGEIISADSRQVYRGMDVGTGKDLVDYTVDNVLIKYHLIDIAEAGEKYDIFRYQTDFHKAVQDITARDKFPIVCGGSGMYIETALGLYDLKEVKIDLTDREELEFKSTEELVRLLESFKVPHNTTDFTDRERLIRAIEIAKSAGKSKGREYDNKPVTPFIYGIQTPREIVRARITNRLKHRLEGGLINEVMQLVEQGIPLSTLYYYGLEYKFVAMHLDGLLSYDELFSKLNTAIHQFAKRQMTWFRRMESRGININWLPNDADVVVDTIAGDLSKAGYL
jgi:tRNA dimethylallyltransferase